MPNEALRKHDMVSSDNIRYVNSAYHHKTGLFSGGYKGAWLSVALFLVLLSGMFGCSVLIPEPFAGTCASDSECTDGSRCLFDLDTGRSACALSCLTDRDCADFDKCQLGYRSVDSEESEYGVCISRVRECSDREECNGLDDDCDGLIDGLDCSPISNCLDDNYCGAYVCSVVENFPFTTCVAPTVATVDDFAPCTDGSQCRNGLCETGRCSPLCRRNYGAPENVCPVDFACAKAGTKVGIPAHNVCQPTCVVNDDCPSEQLCVWREVHQVEGLHSWVCSNPAPDRLPIGSACRRDQDGGDDSCESGLCYGFACTRSCSAVGSPCPDVGPDYVCEKTQLFYGFEEFSVNICVVPE